jgi:hypothetical protein
MIVGLPLKVQAAAGEKKGAPRTSYRFSYTPIYQFETDLESGGRFDVKRHFLRFAITRIIDRNWAVGIGLRFDYENWNFSGIAELAGAELWDKLYRPGISIPIFYTTNKSWRFGIIPAVELAGASGAETDKSLSYGAVLSAAYVFGPDLVLGLGGGIFERLEQTEGFPYVVVDWKINEQWQLNNPFQAGPVGPAGLELIYKPADRWETGVGGAYRSYRFRLDDCSAVTNGIGEVDFWAAFVRLGWQLGTHYRLDINGGALMGGSITIEDENGHKLGQTDYDAAPFTGLTIKGQW